MKKIKREFLKSSNWIQFKKKNDYKATLYYEPSQLTGIDKQFYLYLDTTYKRTIQGLKISAIYFDTTKKIEEHEAIEAIEDIFIRKDLTEDRYNCTEKILLVSGKYKLWKLEFQTTIGEESALAFHADND